MRYVSLFVLVAMGEPQSRRRKGRAQSWDGAEWFQVESDTMLGEVKYV